jgi:prephenate dehydrogenase
VVSLEADEHDRIMAWTQAMTHAAVLGFGYALMKSGMNVDTLLRVAPPPHQTLLALLARLATGAPHVYFDVQCGNACASDAREALQMGMAAVADAALDERAFNDLMARLREWLGERAAPLAQQCQRMFVAGQDLTLEENRDLRLERRD